jgi:hypothetical protein
MLVVLVEVSAQAGCFLPHRYIGHIDALCFFIQAHRAHFVSFTHIKLSAALSALGVFVAGKNKASQRPPRYVPYCVYVVNKHTRGAALLIKNNDCVNKI